MPPSSVIIAPDFFIMGRYSGRVIPHTSISPLFILSKFIYFKLSFILFSKVLCTVASVVSVIYTQSKSGLSSRNCEA